MVRTASRTAILAALLVGVAAMAQTERPQTSDTPAGPHLQTDQLDTGLETRGEDRETGASPGAGEGAEGAEGAPGAEGAEGGLQRRTGGPGEPGTTERSPGDPGAWGDRGDQGRVGTDVTAGTPTESAAAGGHGADDVPSFIMHHVSDSQEYEFEIPYFGSSEINPVIHLPVIRIPLVDGGCPADVHAHAPLRECLDLSITKHTVMMWLAALLIILIFWFVPHRDKKQLVPRGGAANFIEFLVVYIRDEIAIKNIGREYGVKYTPYLCSIFFFILAMNLLGLIPWMATATSNLAITLALALCTFVLTQYASIRAAGLWTYLKHLTGGVHWALWPIMIPVEILGLFTKPFALTVRLFANMLAGHIVIFFLLGLIFILNSAALAAFSVPLAMGIYFLELFVSFVQAYIFTMLSALFIGMGVAMAHHDDHHEEHAEGAHSHDHGKAHMLGG